MTVNITMIAMIRLEIDTLEVKGPGLQAFVVQTGVWQFPLLFNLL